MNLTDKEAKHFYRLFNSLLFYANNKHKIFEGLKVPSDLLKSDPYNLQDLKDKLYATHDLIDSFVKDNPDKFSPEDLNIVSSWKNFVKGKFYIVRYLKNYTVFLDADEPPRAYGVLGIITPIREMMGRNLPIMVEATLLPFENRIVYDGTLLPYNIFFGSNYRRSIHDSYGQAKAGHGIISSLPFSLEKLGPNDAEKLRGYLKTGYSRDLHHEEIQDLLSKNPDLMPVYSEEMGRVHARDYRKRLKAMGIAEGWFALMDGIIIAGGKERENVEQTAKSMLPPAKMKLVHLFQVKAK
ncbi:Uncharacterised protein [uncultured archaeon]|nr:Uncharacterised protein [uncultured archaeon]